MELEWNGRGDVRLPQTGPLYGTVCPPGSKSLTNRALLCAALAKGKSTLTGVLDSEDTRVMIEAWQKLGLELEWDVAQKIIEIDGCGGVIPESQADLYVANSGTSLRFLTAGLAACHGDFRISGVPRMHQRPVADLLLGLRQLGADVESENESNPDCPPVHIRAKGLCGGKAMISGSVSSQFLSGLLMAAPYAESTVEIMLDGPLVSQPYVQMTISVMKAFDVEVHHEEQMYVVPAPHTYLPCRYEIEPDASAASYYFAAAAITGGEITVTGLHRHSLQRDVEFCSVLEQMGCQVTWHDNAITVRGGALRGIDVDMNSISDTVQTLSAVALFAQGATTIRGVAHNRHKETDRISDLATELRKLGATVDEFADGLSIQPGPWKGASIETYNDHRMAMSLSLVGLRVPDVWITNPQCTAKTYPDFFQDIAKLETR